MPRSLIALAASLVSCLALASSAALAAPYTQKAAAWWGNPATPEVNHVVMTTEGVVPDEIVHGTLSFPITCTLPAPSTLKLTGMVIQIDGLNGEGYYGTHAAALLGQRRTFTVDTSKYTDGWHELRTRCYAVETAAGPELGKQTQVTNGHQLFFKNGNALGDPHSAMIGVVDSHPWYDSDAATGDLIHYVYVQLLNIHSLVEAPLRGIVPVTGRVMNAGATTVAHWVLKIDGAVVTEFHDAVQLRTFQLDTRALANGQHTLQFHGHGLARSGKQLAGQVEVPIDVEN
jgi:hypothetical protein